MGTSRATDLIHHVRRFALWTGDGIPLDRELLEAFAANREETSFEGLVRRHGPMVLSVCRRVLQNHEDAEDAFQATFLVLARKAAAVKPRHLVGNWLYGVAYRTALEARTVRRKRLARQKSLTEIPETAAPLPAAARELQLALDEELNRLPDHYRAVIVLCDLEGKTQKEAARQLACPPGTVACRLTRGRSLLAKRLARHGLTFSGGALALALSGQTVLAGVPAWLVVCTVKAATTFAAGGAATSLVSAKVAALTKGVLTAMLLTKLKTAVGMIVAVTFIGIGVGLLTIPPLLPGKPANAHGLTSPATTGEKAEPKDKITKELKLTLSADKTETVMTPDGKDAVPVKLKLTFTNVSDKPIKLNAYLLVWRLGFRCTGPSPDSVHTVILELDLVLPSPAAKDFPVLQPGKGWSWTQSFPGDIPQEIAKVVGYSLRKPGTYKLRFTYKNLKRADGPLAEGTWTGSLESNELELKVRQKAAEPKEGKAKDLKLTLSADKTETVMTPDGKNAVPVKLKLTFTNVSDKPIKLNAYDLRWRLGFRCTGPSPDSVHTDIELVSRMELKSPAAKDYPLLEPGKSWSPEWTHSFPGDIQQETAKNVGYRLRKPGTYKVRFTYENLKKADGPLAQATWTGSLESNELELKVRKKEEAKTKPEGGKAVKVLVGMAEVVEKPAKGSTAFEVQFSLKNVSDKPITVCGYVGNRPLKVQWIGPDGKMLRSKHYDWLAFVDLAGLSKENFVAIPPGGVRNATRLPRVDHVPPSY